MAARVGLRRPPGGVMSAGAIKDTFLVLTFHSEGRLVCCGAPDVSLRASQRRRVVSWTGLTDPSRLADGT